jgi:hypothetical protein
MNYVNPSCELLKNMLKLSKYELEIIKKNCNDFIQSVRIEDKKNQEKQEKEEGQKNELYISVNE